jgi:hypothetical protein
VHTFMGNFYPKLTIESSDLTAINNYLAIGGLRSRRLLICNDPGHPSVSLISNKVWFYSTYLLRLVTRWIPLSTTIHHLFQDLVLRMLLYEPR